IVTLPWFRQLGQMWGTKESYLLPPFRRSIVQKCLPRRTAEKSPCRLQLTFKIVTWKFASISSPMLCLGRCSSWLIIMNASGTLNLTTLLFRCSTHKRMCDAYSIATRGWAHVKWRHLHNGVLHTNTEHNIWH